MTAGRRYGAAMDSSPGGTRPAADVMTERMQTDLVAAMKQRDGSTVTALRTAMAAINNAEAPPVDDATSGPGGGSLGEHTRLVLSAADIDRILRAEIDDRHDTIGQIEPHGQADAVDELRAEITVLERYLP